MRNLLVPGEGTCGTINGADAGGVLFEYGGAPRRMYPGVAALTQLLGVPETCERIVNREGTIAYFFRSRGKTLAIAWRSGEGKEPLKPVRGVTVRDIMGNPVEAKAAVLSESPVYLLGTDFLILHVADHPDTSAQAFRFGAVLKKAGVRRQCSDSGVYRANR